MKAVRIHSFGGPEVLKVEDVEEPQPRSGEVLVRVSAASVNPVDYKIRQGAFPKVTQKDLPIILGRDICGTLQAKSGQTRDVMALLNWEAGGYAEFVALPEVLCVPKPPNLSAVEAAAVPLAAMTAWQGLFDHGQLQRGQRVLIHAGSGGVGHFAVQLAATRGSTVISTASKENLDFVKSLGAETVIDYNSQRFEDVVSDVDVVFDLVGGETRERSWKILRRGGILVSTLGQPSESEAAKYGVRAKGYMTEANGAQLAEIGRLLEARRVRPVVTKTFTLAEAASAQRYLEEQHPRGKVVLER
jgi:NADPH:quinone reductase-like Zn-dependent oxidoreductase